MSVEEYSNVESYASNDNDSLSDGGGGDATEGTETVVYDVDSDNELETKYQKLDNHTKVVASHYNSIEEKGLAERNKSRILYMRNFNNWIKSMFIHEYLTKIKENSKLGAALRVMDMCCGKGGDLSKWQKG